MNINKKDYIKRLFSDFKNLKYFYAGEGISYEDFDEWHHERLIAKEEYHDKFRLENLNKLTKEDFKSFLYFKNNKSWTCLYRQGLKLLKHFDKVKNAIAHLQNEEIPIVYRINDVLVGKLHIKGFGKNIATAILHVTDKEDIYGVWNNRTEDALRKLGIIKMKWSITPGIKYCEINLKLNYLKQLLNTDLIVTDMFIWYISAEPKSYSEDIWGNIL